MVVIRCFFGVETVCNTNRILHSHSVRIHVGKKHRELQPVLLILYLIYKRYQSFFMLKMLQPVYLSSYR